MPVGSKIIIHATPEREEPLKKAKGKTNRSRAEQFRFTIQKSHKNISISNIKTLLLKMII